MKKAAKHVCQDCGTRMKSQRIGLFACWYCPKCNPEGA